jgi:hypothetical protein
MKRLTLIAVLGLAGCIQASTPEELAGSGTANAPAPTGQGDALPSTATEITLKDGSKGWSIACQVPRGWRADPCLKRAGYLCPDGYAIVEQKLGKPSAELANMIPLPGGGSAPIYNYYDNWTVTVRCQT